MALIAAEQISLAGLKPTLNAAAAGDEFVPGDNIFLYVDNASAGSIDATIVTPGKVVGEEIGDVVVPVPAGEFRLIGPFPRQHFAAADGNADITWSATASVTRAVVRL